MFSAGCFFSSIVLRKCIYVVDKSRGRHYSHPCSVMPLAYIPVRSPLSLGALSKAEHPVDVSRVRFDVLCTSAPRGPGTRHA